MKKIFPVILIVTAINCNTTDKNKITGDKVIENTMEKSPALNPEKLDTNRLSERLPIKGIPKAAWQWADKLGHNILVLCSTDLTETSPTNDLEDGRNMELFAFHFVKRDTYAYELLWKITDGISDCPVDITASFIHPATTITDLDSNGIAETIIMYNLACRGDVSPSTLKLLMHEGTKKYALRGIGWVPGDTGNKFPFNKDNIDSMNMENLQKPIDEYQQFLQSVGRYENERDFTAAPHIFLAYSKRQWLLFADETKQWDQP